MPAALIETYDAFYRRMYRPLVGLGVVLSGSAAVGEDIAQEALSAVFRSWERVAQLDDPASWARKVVANQAVSHRRRRSREARAHDRLNPPGRAELLELEARSDLWTAVRALPIRQAVAVALRYAHGLTIDEIAAVMDCGRSTADTHLRRALTRLADTLGSEWKESR